MIDKGYVSSILDGGKKVTVIPATSGDVVTQPLTVPFFLLGTMKPRKEVVFCSFPDGTGLVLAALDGSWNHDLAGSVAISGTQRDPWRGYVRATVRRGLNHGIHSTMGAERVYHIGL